MSLQLPQSQSFTSSFRKWTISVQQLSFSTQSIYAVSGELKTNKQIHVMNECFICPLIYDMVTGELESHLTLLIANIV